jgi:hypothetical protein
VYTLFLQRAHIAHISDNSNAGTVLREKRKRRYRQKKFIQKKVTEEDRQEVTQDSLVDRSQLRQTAGRSEDNGRRLF